jgi:hypothetical protein
MARLFKKSFPFDLAGKRMDPLKLHRRCEMKSGFLLLVLAALLVAMLVPASAVMADNGALALTLSGTKTTIQEEVGGMLAAENMTALAVVPNAELAVSTINIMTDESQGSRMRYIADCNISESYKPTPGAGGDGFARSIQRLIS